MSQSLRGLKHFLPPREHCPSGKNCYNKKDAQTAKNHRYRVDKVELRIYQCHLGDHWHLTSRLEDFHPDQSYKKRGPREKS